MQERKREALEKLVSFSPRQRDAKNLKTKKRQGRSLPMLDWWSKVRSNPRPLRETGPSMRCRLSSPRILCMHRWVKTAELSFCTYQNKSREPTDSGGFLNNDADEQAAITSSLL